MFRFKFFNVILVSLVAIISANAQTTARLQVIHNAADPAADSVDIYLGDKLLLDNFDFREATPYIDAPADAPIIIGVAPWNSTSVNDTITSFTVTLEGGGSYVAMANGVLDPGSFAANPDARDIAFTLFAKANAREAADDNSKVEFFVVHGATDAPTVDVIVRGGPTLVDDAAYGDITNYLAVDPAAYTLDITPGGDNATVVASFDVNLSGLMGGSAVVFASGFLSPINNQNSKLFGIFAALPSGDVVEFPSKMARLQVIHNAADPAAQEVDIYFNGKMLLDDFAFRAATPYIDAPAYFIHNIGVAPANSESFDDTLTSFNVPFDEGGTYVAMANGVLDPGSFAANPDARDIAFTLFAKANAREAADDNSKVEFFVVHGATDAPTVDVIVRGGPTLVDDATYGDITDYLAVDPAAYTLDITPGGDNATVVASFDVNLSGLMGGSAVVFASGFLTPENNQNGEEFALVAALADGNVVIFSTVAAIDPISNLIPASFELKQNYPNPFNPTTTIRFSLPTAELVKLTVYNVLGEEVLTLLNENLAAGEYDIQFDARNMVSGMYFYRIEAGTYTEIRKMMLVK